MARDSIAIQEKHASEKSRASRLRANHMSSSAPASPSVQQGTHGQVPGFSGAFMDGSATPDNTPVLRQGQEPNSLQLEPNAPPMHEFDSFFSSGFDANWQPAEVASAAYDGNAIGLPSWLPAMTDMYADLNFGPWPLGADVMNGHLSDAVIGRNPLL